MGRIFRIIGAGVAAVVVAAIAWQLRPLPAAIDLFETTQEPPGWNGGVEGPLGIRPIKNEKPRFVHVNHAVALKELYAADPPFNVVIGPFENVRYRVNVESVERVGDEGQVFSIRGSVDSDFYGRLNLVLTEKLARGTLHVDQHVYEFLPVASDITAIFEVEQEKFPREKKPTPAHKARRNPPTPIMRGDVGLVGDSSLSIGANEGVGEAREVVGLRLPIGEKKPFTEVTGAKQAEPEEVSGNGLRSVAPRGVLPEISVLVIRADRDAFKCRPLAVEDGSAVLADAAVLKGNLDYALKSVATSRVTLVCLSEIFDSNWTSRFGNNWEDPGNARVFLMGQQEILNERVRAEADVVVLVIGPQYSDEYCGWSAFPDYPEYAINLKTIPSNDPSFDPARPNATWADFFALNAAFSVVVDGCEEGNYSMEHEIGHLLGMKHERFNDFGGDFYNCGYGYPVMRWFRPVGRTVMAYPGYCSYRGVDLERCRRINEYSFTEPRERGFLGWVRWVWHSFAGPIKGRSCKNCGIDSMTSAASNLERLKETAHLVATYSDRL